MKGLRELKRKVIGLLERIGEDPKFFGFVCFLPSIALIIVLNIFPLVYSFLISFCRYRLKDIAFSIWPTKFVGFNHYLRMFTRDVAWVITMQNTIYWIAAGLGVTLPICFGIALVLNEEFKGVKLVRVIPTLMWAVPSIAQCLIWSWIFHGEIGLVNNVLRVLGIIRQPIVWLLGTWTARGIVAVSQFFFTCPFIILMLLAALQGVPKYLYESSMLDGASALKRFIHITVPSIKNALITATALLTMWNINLFTFPFVITKGDPFFATETMSFYVYQQGFEWWNIGYATALAWVLLSMTIFGAYLNIRRLEI